MILSNSDDQQWWPVRCHIVGHDKVWLVIDQAKSYTSPLVGFALDIELRPGVSIFGTIL